MYMHVHACLCLHGFACVCACVRACVCATRLYVYSYSVYCRLISCININSSLTYVYLIFLHIIELIANQRLSSVETTGRKRCISCSSSLCTVQERPPDKNAVDPFEVNEVQAQEETPFTNPTEAQV